MESDFSAYNRDLQLQGRKRQSREEVSHNERPQKRIKALLDEDDSSGNERTILANLGGASLPSQKVLPYEDGFTVNQEFARRFEHNKKREDLQRLEEKYGSDESSSESEEEDDEGILVSEALDAQISSTLEAIRRKDPCVYDDKQKFYTDSEVEGQNGLEGAVKEERPMYLSDYHRRNLLEERVSDNDAEDVSMTYAQQQDDLKTTLVKEMHAVANGGGTSEDDQSDEDGSDGGFLVKKPSRLYEETRPGQAIDKQQSLSIEAADKDPDNFLSNYMSARAWVPSNGSRFQPFESDNEEEERRAEAFEEAYNLRFEDPKSSNEKLLSHARDAASKYSVRKEEMNPRKKAREAERAKKDAARRAREEEKARMRKLRVAEAEDKIKKIKEAAGLRGASLHEEDWSGFLEEGWDDARWEQEMKTRFGDEYYADHDPGRDYDGNFGGNPKLRKPKWDDDIDIGDLVPEFEAGKQAKPQFSLTDNESASVGSPTSDRVNGGLDGDGHTRHLKGEKANSKRKKDEEKKSARKERQKIERLIDQQMDVDETLSRFSKKHAGHFRYRNTSPTAYGLTAHDILMASDSQLNQYAGLKKMAAFRDPDKKRKDKKHLSKKARLRQWRKDTFGNELGPQTTVAEISAGRKVARDTPKVNEGHDNETKGNETKRTRSKQSKARSNLA